MLYAAKPPILQVMCPLTGSRWMRRVLRRVNEQGATRTVIETGAPVWKIDDREEYKFIRDNPQCLRVGTVRDPWTWYVEAWAEALRIGGQSLDSLRQWGRGSTAFRDVLYGWTHPEHLGVGLAIGAPQPLGVVWEPDDVGAWEGLLASTLGLYSFSLLYHYGLKHEWQTPQVRPRFGVDLFIDAGRRYEALSRILGRAITPEEFPLRRPLTEETKAVLRGMYDRRMIGWVDEADRPVIALMDYAPFMPSGRPMPVVSVRRRGETRKGPAPVLSKEERFRFEKAKHDRLTAIKDKK